MDNIRKGVSKMESWQDFVATIMKMQWSDYLDIIVVAFLIYRILPLLQTPSTKRIAKTVLLVVGIAAVTEIAHLYTLSWIVDQFLSVGLLAMVILFQPELRRMMDRLGSVQLRSFLGSSKPVQEMDTVIAQTVMACETMSKEKVGALIVFSREARLDEYFKTGTQIDGQVSEQLLRNIFFPKAALHDGAMIIRDGRVAAAGCVLPLSDSHRLSADLGTRHRAGVGISEVSDAVTIIVSEETGTISVAVGGMLKRHLAAKTLERLLHNELCPKQEDPTDMNLLEKAKRLVTLKMKEADEHVKK